MSRTCKTADDKKIEYRSNSRGAKMLYWLNYGMQDGKDQRVSKKEIKEWERTHYDVIRGPVAFYWAGKAWYVRELR